MRKKRKPIFQEGYAQYRYGAKKPVSLAPVFSKEERRHVIDKVMDIMADWRETPFEMEGQVRAGLRSALCLAGNGWARSDTESSLVLNEIFMRFGANRPDWARGQPEYTIPRENCAWCHIEIPEELLNGGQERTHSFCSRRCAKNAIEQRQLSLRKREYTAFKDAWDILQRDPYPTQDCAHCGCKYRPLFGRGRFCSLDCSSKYQRTEPILECVHCRQPFQARMSHGTRARFCSLDCKQRAGHRTSYDRHCIACGDRFKAKLARGRVCSKGCSSWFQKFVRPKRLPKSISPRLFDYIFIATAPTRHPETDLTSEIFDGWFKEAA